MSPRKKSTIKKIARTVYIPESLNEWLTEEADRRGYSVNSLILMGLELLKQGAPLPPADSDIAGFD